MGDTAGFSPPTTRVTCGRRRLSRVTIALDLICLFILLSNLGHTDHPTPPFAAIAVVGSHHPFGQVSNAAKLNLGDSSSASLSAPTWIGLGRSRMPTSAPLALHDDAFVSPRPPRVRVPAADIPADGSSLDGLAPVKWTPANDVAIVPGFYQTSEFMFGTVAVGVVFPQCNGTIDRCSETWTDAAIDEVLAQIKAGTDWWVDRMQGRVRFALYPERKAPTGYEPIQHSQRDEKLWIGDVLTNLGFGGSDYLDQDYAYNNWLRQQHHTDWAFTLFIANSAASPNGTFANGYFSYSYVPGPFTVATFDNGQYTIRNMAAVIAHETGHIFGALDEYASAKVSCTATSGYLGLPNQNSQQNCSSNVDSIMRGGLYPYERHLIDPFALGMVGQRVSGEGNLPDPINTKPVVVLGPVAAMIGRNDPTIEGIAQDVPYAQGSNFGVTINCITKVEYRVDGGAWQPAVPSGSSGTFGRVRQPFSFTPWLSRGRHVLEIQATNRVGALSQVVTTVVTVEDVP